VQALALLFYVVAFADSSEGSESTGRSVGCASDYISKAGVESCEPSLTGAAKKIVVFDPAGKYDVLLLCNDARPINDDFLTIECSVFIGVWPNGSEKGIGIDIIDRIPIQLRPNIYEMEPQSNPNIPSRRRPSIVKFPLEGNSDFAVESTFLAFGRELNRAWLEAYVSSEFFMPDLFSRINGVISRSHRIASGRCGISSVVRGKASRHQREEAEDQPKYGNPCLLVGRNGHCVGGVRRTSLMYKIVCAQAMLLFGFSASFALYRAFPQGKRVNRAWAALAAAWVVLGVLFLVSGITGKLWLFGI
jgi:hypothetical protein